MGVRRRGRSAPAAHFPLARTRGAPPEQVTGDPQVTTAQDLLSRALH